MGSTIAIPNPKAHQIEEALELAGYPEERARTLAQRSGGHLSSLLRCLQNLSLMPQWAEGTAAAELAIAELLGLWSEHSEADRSVVEELSGNAYGEWIGKIRDITVRPGTPLIQREGIWKFVSRFEGWYALGPRVFDEHLDRFKSAAIKVLTEHDPKFELPKESRFAAVVYGKSMAHSQPLRHGIVETLALLGSHAKALTNCSFGYAEGVAVCVVRELFEEADWVLWASLNDLLPLLAEAAPQAFLDAVEKAIAAEVCPFDTVFAQEGVGAIGQNHMTGLLWALETLAWDEAYLPRVVLVLGTLSARDPGGSWANRPAGSLRKILLPWLPQTVASVEKRKLAVTVLLKELPNVGWQLLLCLLPEHRSTTDYTRKPAWREIVPDDWHKEVTPSEYWTQIQFYSDMALVEAKRDVNKLCSLIKCVKDLPKQNQEKLLAYLGSESLLSMTEAERMKIWNELNELVRTHQKYSDAEWTMKPEEIAPFAQMAQQLMPSSPALIHQHLFCSGEMELYEERGNYEEQKKVFDARRLQALQEISQTGGVQAIIDFAQSVEAAWRVGAGFGKIWDSSADEKILPSFLDLEGVLSQFIGSFIRARYWTKGWEWVDQLSLSDWSPTQIGRFLSFLPFNPETWTRAEQLLGEHAALYWRETNVNAFDAEGNLEQAIDKLLQYDRPHAALNCLDRQIYQEKTFSNAQAVSVLLATLHAPDKEHQREVYIIKELIQHLQEDPRSRLEDLYRIEWIYLQLLNGTEKSSPKFLFRRLAEEPLYFCSLIQLIYHSRHETPDPESISEQQKSIATQAYRLLHDWKVPPGVQEDQSVDEQSLQAWIQVMKAETSKSGHLDIALSTAGKVFIHAPSDADGLWPHHSIAKELNAQDAEPMREGFRTGLFNSRGVYWIDPSGKQERELAADYRQKASKIESAGFLKLAATLRMIADTYDQEAERSIRKSQDFD